MTGATVSHELQLDALGLLDTIVQRAPAIVIAVLIIVATRFTARFVSRSATAVGARAIHSESLRILLEKTAVVGAWCFGIVLAALIAFPGLRLGDIFATLGLTSVAIGFAFQDIFKNFLAGVLLLLNEPFRIGDQIIVGTYEGTVEHINIRFTSLRTYHGERVLVPNATVFTSPVQVRTAFDSRRIDVEVGLVYGTDVPRALEVLLESVRGVEGVAEAPATRVDATTFDESSIDFVVRFWCEPHQIEVLKTTTRVIASMDAGLKAAGLEIAFPTRTIVAAAPFGATATAR